MANNSIDKALELAQEAELTNLLCQHQKDKKHLLHCLISLLHQPQVPVDTPIVLSHSNKALHQGDGVKLCTTSSISTKGDIATVLYVSLPWIDIKVHCLNKTTWQKANNLDHCTTDKKLLLHIFVKVQHLPSTSNTATQDQQNFYTSHINSRHRRPGSTSANAAANTIQTTSLQWHSPTAPGNCCKGTPKIPQSRTGQTSQCPLYILK